MSNKDQTSNKETTSTYLHITYTAVPYEEQEAGSKLIGNQDRSIKLWSESTENQIKILHEIIIISISAICESLNLLQIKQPKRRPLHRPRSSSR